jgi:Rieske Fe-S protein
VALVFAFLWIREATKDYRVMPEIEPETREREIDVARPVEPLPAHVGEAAMPEPEPGEIEEIERYPRSKFLEFSTLGLGAAIGAVVTLPPLGFAVIPAFIHQEYEDIDLGPISNFPKDQFVIATFMSKPEEGEVSRRTAYIRNNGNFSFTILSNRCAHLGCPVQPGGPVADKQKKVVKEGNKPPVDIIPTQPANFNCPCHGGSYDTEGNRIAGPPVRALDRYEYEIRNNHLVVGKPFSVGSVTGTGADAKIKKYPLTNPGDHVDGPEAWLYPVQPTQISS